MEEVVVLGVLTELGNFLAEFPLGDATMKKTMWNE